MRALNPIRLIERVSTKILDGIRLRFIGKGENVGTQNQKNREAWLEKVLVDIAPGKRILDAGAGQLRYKRLCSHLNYVAQDFGRYNGFGDDKGLQTGAWDQSKLDIVSDITKIPEPDGSFDAIMCVEVLEHVPSPVDALRELSRLLRPNGILIVTTPFCSLTHYSPYFFQTGFSQNFYQHWFRELGFDIIEADVNGNYFEWIAQELRRLPRVAGQYANGSMRWFERQALKRVLGALSRFSHNDCGSEQLLSYGLHIVARKLGK